MTIPYLYYRPALDAHSRSGFSLQIHGPQHPFVPVLEETLDLPDGAAAAVVSGVCTTMK